MKRESIISWVVYILVFAGAIVYGFTVLRTHFDYSHFQYMKVPVLMYAIYIILSVFFGVFITAILQEFGHFLGAKVGGYKILSWCCIYFTFYKEEGKRKFRFKSFDGLTGETKIVPDYSKKEQPNPYPFLTYGSIFNIVWITACIVMFVTYSKETSYLSDLAYGFLTMGIIAIFATIYNIVPVKLDALNDGYRLASIKKDVASFNKSLLAENNYVPSKEENVPEEALSDRFIPDVCLNKAYELMAEEHYEEAEQKILEIFEHEKETPKKTLAEATSQKIYLKIMSKPLEEVKEFYDNEVPFSLRKELSNSYTMPEIRTYILMSSILDGSKSECLLALNKVLKAYKNLPTNKRQLEATIYNRTLDKVIDAHPKWEEIPNYKLVS